LPLSPESASPVFTIADGCATVRLNRPQHHNRIEPADVGALHDILTAVDQDESVRVLVLTGSGTSFCAGYDLVTIASGSGSQGRDEGSGGGGVHDFEDVVARLESCTMPTVCGLNGPVYGGGADLALACDFRVGVSATHVVIPASRLGVHYYHGGLRRFVTRLGLGASMRLLVMSQQMDAAEMLRIGFLNEVVATPELLHARIAEIADALARLPVPAVVDGMKRALNRIAQGDMDSGEADAAWAASVRSQSVARAAAERLAAARRAKEDSGE
jgi:enoyl-CoA hydratase